MTNVRRSRSRPNGDREIRIRSESGEETTLRREGDTWQVVEPVAAPADPGEVSGLTSSLASLRIQRTWTR
jgi:hypothetical protein